MKTSQAMEELKKNFENQVRAVEEKLGRELGLMQENHEKQVNSCLYESQENNTFKNRLAQMVKRPKKPMKRRML